MPSYLLIEARDPFESGDTAFIRDLAIRLSGAGNRVTLFLVQNGVLPTRSGCHALAFAELAAAGVELLADDFSLRERGVDRLQPGIKPAAIDVVIDHMAQGTTVIWH